MTEEKNIWLIDSTLRDGEQAPGVSFSRSEKIRLASMLNEIGIDEIEAGIPVMNKEIAETIRQITLLNLKARILVWSRALFEDIEASAHTGAGSIHIAFPISDIQLITINKDWHWVEESISSIIAHAKHFFDHVSVGAQDASRSNMERIQQFATMAVQAGAERIRLADTVGILTPMGTKILIEAVQTCVPNVNIDFHAHNDLGMATGNAVTAWQSGASSISATVNGLGERAGNASLEEVIMASSMNGALNKYNTPLLYDLCRYVSDISRRPIPLDKPISGEMVFSHESGIHVKSTLKNPIAFQAFSGKNIGRENYRYVYGKHSGNGALKSLLEDYHIPCDPEKIISLKRLVFQFASQNKRDMLPDEVLKAYIKLTHHH